MDSFPVLLAFYVRILYDSSKIDKGCIIMTKLVAATNNKGKIKEIKAILGGLGFEVVSQSELGLDLDVEETGTTFTENALLKARAAAQASGIPAIADDSGLCVDALGGAPGVYSARYAGEGATDAMLIEKLLKNMEGIEKEKRGARFVSAVAFVTPQGEEFTALGEAEGRITEAPFGDGGFGYDPIFYSTELDKTYAQMSAQEKNSISHRYRALMALKDILEKNYKK
jgi:XTP/dITP diphosphohydrolase